MKGIILFCSILLFVGHVLGAVPTEQGCTLGNGVTLGVGEYYYEGEGCVAILCKAPGHMTGKSCGVQGIPPNYECDHIPQDNSKPFPDCCEKYVNCREK